jgi:hypothetical protein
MTTKTRCHDCNVQLNSSNAKLDTSRINRMCDRCYDMAGLENEHQDGYHEDQAVADCLMCNPDARGDRSRKGHEGTAPKTQGSHADCYAKGAHEATKAGRAACRKGRKA